MREVVGDVVEASCVRCWRGHHGTRRRPAEGPERRPESHQRRPEKRPEATGRPQRDPERPGGPKRRQRGPKRPQCPLPPPTAQRGPGKPREAPRRPPGGAREPHPQPQRGPSGGPREAPREAGRPSSVRLGASSIVLPASIGAASNSEPCARSCAPLPERSDIGPAMVHTHRPPPRSTARQPPGDTRGSLSI